MTCSDRVVIFVREIGHESWSSVLNKVEVIAVVPCNVTMVVHARVRSMMVIALIQVVLVVQRCLIHRQGVSQVIVLCRSMLVDGVRGQG